MLVRKTRRADLRRAYALTLEAGLIAAFAICIAAFRIPLQPDGAGAFDIRLSEQEIAHMEEISPTQQPDLPPPPPRPSTPVEVPDEIVLDEEVIDFDATLQLDEPLAVLPTPPPPPRPAAEAAKPEAEEEEEIFIVVEEMPELIGGIESIQRRIRYPELARRAGLEGRVFVEFVVDPSGSVRDPKVLRGIGGGCDEEAIRAIMEAKFKPGRQRGRPVPVRMSIPVRFELRGAK